MQERYAERCNAAGTSDLPACFRKPLGDISPANPPASLRVSTGVTTTADESSVRCTGHLFTIFDDLVRSSSVISVSTLMTREISQIAKAMTVETIATIRKGTMTHEEGRTARRPRILTDERG